MASTVKGALEKAREEIQEALALLKERQTEVLQEVEELIEEEQKDPLSQGALLKRLKKLKRHLCLMDIHEI